MHQKIKFYKYQGAGNDFILIDNRKQPLELFSPQKVKQLCNRRFGIGADGLMLLQNAKSEDFEMRYFNANGHEGSMCGNGGRCIVAFARDRGIITDKTDFMAVDGRHHASIQKNQVTLDMIDVRQIDTDGNAYIINTGSPHYVVTTQNLKHLNVYEQGRNIRYNDLYHKEGINVNFVEKEGDGYFMRTYERGVEDETYACGTGATAAAIAMAYQQNLKGYIEIPIRVIGGQLSISFYKDGKNFTDVNLNGPANFVYEGIITL